MQEFIISFMEQFGYLGVMLLIALENIFPPIPSEIILTFGGFMTTTTSLNIFLVILFATIGSVLGAILLYLLGRILNKDRLEKIIDGKIGKVLRLKKADIEKADYWFDHKGYYTVFFCRLIPVVRSLISIPAGMSEMPFLKFLVFTTFGSLIWNTVLIFLGSLAGNNWHKIVEFIGIYSKIIVLVLVLLIILGIVYFIKKKKNKCKN